MKRKDVRPLTVNEMKALFGTPYMDDGVNPRVFFSFGPSSMSREEWIELMSLPNSDLPYQNNGVQR